MTDTTSRVPGRPRIGRAVQVRLSDETLGALNELAEATDFGRTELIRMACDDFARQAMPQSDLHHLNVGSVIRCGCGCGNAHIRAQDGSWLHVTEVTKGDPRQVQSWASDPHPEPVIVVHSDPDPGEDYDAWRGDPTRPPAAGR